MTVALPRESGKEGVCIALAGDFPMEVIHIELQNLYWIVSIIKAIADLIEKFINRKKK